MTATLQSDPTKYTTAEVRFGDVLPTGVIAMAEGTMNRATAIDYSLAQGGRLPLIKW